MPVSTGTAPSGTGFSEYVGPNSPPRLLKRDSHPEDDYKKARCPIKAPQVPVEYSVTPVFRVRIVDPLVATTALKVVRKTPPCASERDRLNLEVFESAERVTQGHF